MTITIFDFPTRLIFGLGSLSELGKEAAGLGRKALIVTQPDLRKAGILDRALKKLSSCGLQTLVFDEVESNPRSSTIDRGAQILRTGNADMVIGLGGGSAMDAAKGIALAGSGVEPIWKYAESKIVPGGAVPPILQVPTLAGTGAEISRGAVITNWENHVKKSIVSPAIQARVAIVDPEVTLTVPAAAAKAGAVDAFSHVLEPYITDADPAPLTDGIRETIMKTVLEYLPKMALNPQDLEARIQLSWASTLAMSQIPRLGGGGGFMPCHGLGHALSGYYNIPHGQTLAALLPAWMTFTFPARQDRFARLGSEVFHGNAIPLFEDWLKNLGLILSLSSLGFKLDSAEEIAGLAVRTSLGLRHNPVLIDEKAATEIYRKAY